jgi:hypothetical protein
MATSGHVRRMGQMERAIAATNIIPGKSFCDLFRTIGESDTLSIASASILACANRQNGTVRYEVEHLKSCLLKILFKLGDIEDMNTMIQLHIEYTNSL